MSLTIRKGFVDLHTHGIGRYSTKTSDPDEILNMAGLYLRAGITAFLPTIYSDIIKQMRANMEAIRKACKIQETEGESSRLLGVHLEGPFLNPSMAGAQNRDTFLKPTISNLMKLIEGYEDIIKVITIAPELPGAIRLIERCVERGIRVNMGHSDATYNQALKAKEAGATGITHIFNAMRQIHHREIGLAGFGLIDKDIYIEVIGDGIHIDMNMLRLIFRIKNPQRVILVSDSIGGDTFKKGDRLIGSPMNLSEAFKNLVDAGIPVDLLEKFIYENPVRYLE